MTEIPQPDGIRSLFFPYGDPNTVRFVLIRGKKGTEDRSGLGNADSPPEELSGGECLSEGTGCGWRNAFGRQSTGLICGGWIVT